MCRLSTRLDRHPVSVRGAHQRSGRGFVEVDAQHIAGVGISKHILPGLSATPPIRTGACTIR